MGKSFALCAVIALCAAQAFAINHTVTFRKMDGTVLSEIEVAHGEDATELLPALPAETDMTAKGWDHADWLANVTNDVTCWALYEASTAKSPNSSIASQSVVDRATPYSLDEYFQIYSNLAWSDEFSGSSLSVGTGTGKNWNYDTEQRNNELQKYTTSGGNHIVSDGTLKLRCKRESSGDKSFTSGSIKSNGKVQFKYGRCEIRAKLTKQKGTWPAFWTMGTGNWPACGELDVFEQINGSEWIGGNFHLPKGSSDTIANFALAGTEDGTHWGDAFHRIGFIFNEFEIVWYVDDHIFKRMDIRNTSRYSMMHDRYRYILLNLAFGGNWPGQTSASDSSIADFQGEDFEIDYCRIFTNTTANRTVAREEEPAGVKLAKPVSATVWRGWQMRWGKSGAYRSGLDRTEAAFCKAAMTEYFARDNADIVTFLTRPAENTGSSDLVMPFNVPGVTSLFLSPEQGNGNNGWEGDTREKLLSGVLFNKNRFSQSRSAVSALPLANDASYTNCCAVVAELVEKDSGAKVKVVSVNLSQTNGTDYATLFNKLNQFKDERTILFFQSMDSAFHTPLRNQASSKLDKSYKYIGEYKAWPTYQFSYATTNCVSATAENPAPLSVLKSNGQPSGVHTNQAYCATIQFESQIVSASDAAGFDWTNRLVTVTGLTAGASVTLTVAGTGGTAAAQYTATADESGAATFDVATAPRVAYEYSVSQDGATVASGAFLSGGWKDSWFAASAASGESVVVNGEWDREPRILASGGYAFDGGGETRLFSLGEAAAEKGRGALARVDMSVVFTDIDGRSSLGSYAATFGCITATTDGASDGTAAWMAFDGSVWRPLSGRGASAAPSIGVPYIVRAEADFAASPALVRYFVSDDGGGTFAALEDGDGNDFIRCAAPPDSSGLSGVAVDGCGTVASFEGSLAYADVAEADGEGYESLADAIASATNSLVLLTNVTFPTNAPVGTVAVDGGGFSLAGVALDGSGKAVVTGGYSAIPGEGRINISLAQVASLGVATTGRTPAEIASALAENGANGIPRWKSYVLGLDPADSAAKPKASIAVNGGKVELSLVGIEVNAASGATVTYRVLAAEDVKDIADAQPVDGVAPASAGAAVELPKDDSKPQMFYRLEIDVKGF